MTSVSGCRPVRARSRALSRCSHPSARERVPAPASRRDHYRLRDNAWAIQYTNQNDVTSAVLKAAEAGTAATDDGSLARQRLTQMRDFYNFLFEEIPALLDRWYQRSGLTETYPTVARACRIP